MNKDIVNEIKENYKKINELRHAQFKKAKKHMKLPKTWVTTDVHGYFDFIYDDEFNPIFTSIIGLYNTYITNETLKEYQILNNADIMHNEKVRDITLVYLGYYMRDTSDLVKEYDFNSWKRQLEN